MDIYRNNFTWAMLLNELLLYCACSFENFTFNLIIVSITVCVCATFKAGVVFSFYLKLLQLKANFLFFVSGECK